MFFFSRYKRKITSNYYTFDTCLNTWARDEISKEVIKLICETFYSGLFGELMVYTPHSGNYIYPGVQQVCQEN